MVVFPITGCAVLVVINPAGPVTTVFSVSDIPSTGLNSTMQVRVTLDPTGRMGLTWSLETDTDNGAGTGEKKVFNVTRYHSGTKVVTIIIILLYLHTESTERVSCLLYLDLILHLMITTFKPNELAKNLVI